jgi:hypothetical protein
MLTYSDEFGSKTGHTQAIRTIGTSKRTVGSGTFESIRREICYPN